MSNLNELFPAFYEPSAYDLSNRQRGAYRRTCTFALDANVLLGLYAYSSQTRNDFLQILDSLGDRVWLPHQAAYEFEKNRTARIQTQVKYSRTVRELLSSLAKTFGDDARNQHPKIGGRIQHPFLTIEDIQSQLAEVIDSISSKLKPKEDDYAALLEDDPIREHLNLITRDRIGEPYSRSELEAIYDEGAKRYSREQPPGYMDAKKPNPKKGIEKFGDLVLWKQLIDRAKETGYSIYFVTDDLKEDWWRQRNKEPVGPRRELIDEMKECTSQRFLISTSADFYRWAGNHVGSGAREAAIAEARSSAVPGRRAWATAMLGITPDMIEMLLPYRELSSGIKRIADEIAAAGEPSRAAFALAVEEMLEDLRRKTIFTMADPLSLFFRQLDELGLPKSAGSSADNGDANGDVTTNDQTSDG